MWSSSIKKCLICISINLIQRWCDLLSMRQDFLWVHHVWTSNLNPHGINHCHLHCGKSLRSSAALTSEALLSRRCWSSMGSRPWWVCCAAPAYKWTRRPRLPSATCPLNAPRARRRSTAAAASKRPWLCSEIQTLRRYRNSWQVQSALRYAALYSTCVSIHTPYTHLSMQTSLTESHLSV